MLSSSPLNRWSSSAQRPSSDSFKSFLFLTIFRFHSFDLFLAISERYEGRPFLHLYPAIGIFNVIFSRGNLAGVD